MICQLALYKVINRSHIHICLYGGRLLLLDMVQVIPLSYQHLYTKASDLQTHPHAKKKQISKGRRKKKESSFSNLSPVIFSIPPPPYPLPITPMHTAEPGTGCSKITRVKDKCHKRQSFLSLPVCSSSSLPRRSPNAGGR